MIKEKAYAKVNLSLRVYPTNEDGYHNINSLMVPIDLYDELYFSFSDKDEVVTNIYIENNVILKTLKLFKETYKLKENVKIEVNKKIPIAAGLAGGSSDASATLRGLNRLFNLNISLKELEKLANMLGSDNTFTLYSKPAICTGRGEILDFISKIKEIPLIIIKPNFGLSTKTIYDNYEYIEKEDNTLMIKDALIKGDLSKLEANIFNDLEKPALKNDEYNLFCKKFEALNIKSYQSGSGPTRYVFDLKQYKSLNKNFSECAIIKTKIINNL